MRPRTLLAIPALLITAAAMATAPEEPASPFTPMGGSATTVDGGLSRGVAWGDFDGDRLPDLVVANTIGYPEFLYRNVGGGRFEQVLETDPTLAGGFTEGVSWADHDNDGDLDLLLTSTDGPGALFRNDGSGGLARVDAGDLTSDAAASSMACWADFDADGRLDVLVVNRAGVDDALYRNDGAQFVRVRGLPFDGSGGDGRACAWGDADGDGDLDVYVANFVRGTGSDAEPERNRFYRNAGEGRFLEVTGEPFVTERALSYGASWADVEDDGDLDLFVTNVGEQDPNRLYLNDGTGRLQAADSMAVRENAGASKGHTWGDFDLDGRLDLYVVNGTEGLADNRNALYLGTDGPAAFVRVATGAVVDDNRVSAGAAWSDMDLDGDLDLYVANWGGSDQDNDLYRNDISGRSWLALHLVGTASDRMGFGTHVAVVTSTGGASKTRHRWHLPQTGYASQNQPIVHVGLGDSALVSELRIDWPSGQRDVHRNIDANRYYLAREGSALASLETRKITNVKDRYPFWSPDGSQVVFSSDRSGTPQIWLMNADGSGLRRLTHGDANDDTPVWTPDGRFIVFVSDRDGNLEIYRMRPDGSEPLNLTRHPAPDGHPKISPDGSKVVFNSGRSSDPALFSGEAMVRGMNHEIYEMDMNGEGVARLTDHPEWDTYPSLSPDGLHLLWRRVVRDARGIGDSEVFIAARDGSEPRNLTRNAAFDGYPAWSPDGSWIAFASNRDGGDDLDDFNLYVVRPDGSGLRRLTHSPGYEDARPIWSGDGKRIIFNRQIGGSGAMEIFILPFE